MKTLLLLVVLLLQGCALGQYLRPTEPTALPPGRQPGHYISMVEPQLTIDWRILGLFRYLRWDGEERFQSFVVCPFGFADYGEKRHCLQMYWGVKIDGTESHILQETDMRLWDYVFTQAEQASFRWHGVCGEPDVYDMGGC